MNISEKFIEWWNRRSLEEKHDYVKNKSIQLNNIYKKLQKSLNAELLYTGVRKGIRGGKITTLQSRTTRLSKEYYDGLNELKYIVKTI